MAKDKLEELVHVFCSFFEIFKTIIVWLELRGDNYFYEATKNVIKFFHCGSIFETALVKCGHFRCDFV